MDAMILFLLLSFIFSTTTAQPRYSNISLGSSLSPSNNSYWLSESGEFAFGFYPQGNGFAVGIWFAKIQEKTVTWTANRDDPPLPGDVRLILNNDGTLILQQTQGQQTPISNASQPASSASMLNTGNFVLYNSHSTIIWQTFDAPTDTILPGQRILAGNQMVSSISETNHSSGKFRLTMQHDGNLVQYPVGYPAEGDYAYWNTETFNAGDNVSLNLDSNGQLYLLNITGFNIKNLSSSGSISDKALSRATIDADGIFRLYSYSLSQYGNWSIEWSSSNNRCDPKGLCGLNSYCTLMDQDIKCVCLPGFDFIDQSQENLGCGRNFIADGCRSKIENISSVHELSNISWEDDPYDVLSTVTKNTCRDECFKDCDCEVAVYRNQECRKQKLPLRLGRIQLDEQVTTFVKEVTRDSGGKERKKELRMDILITGIAFLALAFLILTFASILVYRYRVWEYKKNSNQTNDGFTEDVTLRSFTFDELTQATNGFMDQIGRGAFGTVFKGVISNGNRVVAIKRLEKVVDEGEREFQNEVKVIGRTHHKNLVRLLGYCHDGNNRLLVYEFMSKGSLADFLFKSERKPTWEERVGIALNIARGIFYLHEECERQIIHCDIKPENILMDDNSTAKIADFGLAKLLMPYQTRTNTGMKGTRGYVAPEWHRNLPITVKADVYSFGIMFLEIICCRRSVDQNAPEDEVVLAHWVYDCFEAHELDKVVQDEEVEKDKLERMVRVGLWCIQDEPSFRPSMKKVVLMLEGTVDIPVPPSPTSFLSSM